MLAMRNEGPHRPPYSTVAGLVLPGARTIGARRPFVDVVVILFGLPPGHDLYVVEPDGRYVGAVVLQHLEPHLDDTPHLRAAIAADLVDAAIQPVAADLPIAELARWFARTRSQRLPVVDSAHRLLGTVSKTDLALRGRFG